jgi:hypothetical protein
MLGGITVGVSAMSSFTVEITPGGDRVVSHAGAALLAEAADRLGLTPAPSPGRAGMRHGPARRPVTARPSLSLPYLKAILEAPSS